MSQSLTGAGVGGQWRLGGAIRRLRSLATRGLDLLLPPVCNFCGVDLPSPAEPPLLCQTCREAFLTLRGAACRRCAMPLAPGTPDDGCPHCRGRRYRFDAAIAMGVYRGELRDAVIRMKRRVHEALTLSMGYLLADCLREALADNPPDLVVPVPAHWLKQWWRGFNGPDLLTEAVGRRLNLPWADDVLRCRRRTRKQGTLLPSERAGNVRNAFAFRSSYNVSGARLLLVDDIMTTGSTASEAARTLRKAGAAGVTVAVVARGAGLGQR